MAVPKHKVTRSKRNMRRAHDAIGTGTYEECPSTGELKLRHHVSPDGSYRGKQILKTKAPKAATETAAAE